jgi:hypothetical protein
LGAGWKDAQVCGSAALLPAEKEIAVNAVAHDACHDPAGRMRNWHNRYVKFHSVLGGKEFFTQLTFFLDRIGGFSDN